MVVQSLNDDEAERNFATVGFSIQTGMKVRGLSPEDDTSQAERSSMTL